MHNTATILILGP